MPGRLYANASAAVAAVSSALAALSLHVGASYGGLLYQLSRQAASLEILEVWGPPGEPSCMPAHDADTPALPDAVLVFSKNPNYCIRI